MHDIEKPEVFLVTKPLVPPWDDSAKNIAHAQVRFAGGYRYRALVTKERGSSPLSPQCTCVPLYDDQGTYAAGLSRNLRVFLYGVRPRGAALYHYFFAPNPVTSLAGRALAQISGVPSVQTICSIPRNTQAFASLLFADAVIALSQHTRGLCIASGFPAARISVVRPGIEPIARPKEEKRAATKSELGLPPTSRIVLYPGDLEFSSASRTVAAAAESILIQNADAVLVLACRAKTGAAAQVLGELKRRLESHTREGRVVFLEHVQDMPALVGASDAVVLPAETLYAKMDAPLVVLEAMSQRIPVVLADVGPLSELLETGCGIGVAPADPGRLATAVSTILSTPSLAETLGQRGEAAVATTFNAAAMSQAVETIYDEVLR
ncbi:MAG: glycosyltransferase family 4 protein [Myxococcota bacterium]|jgi:glycosyltransferase involved in cell wall biosynthesis|nr:glycosyltransferase family 4 protein [Myxococcota bacterium]